MYRLLVFGSKSIDNYRLITAYLDRMVAASNDLGQIVVITGRDLGTDRIVRQWAEEKGYRVESREPSWDPPRGSANGAVLFWDGASSYTSYVRNKLAAAGIPYRFVVPDNTTTWPSGYSQ